MRQFYDFIIERASGDVENDDKFRFGNWIGVGKAVTSISFSDFALGKSLSNVWQKWSKTDYLVALKSDGRRDIQSTVQTVVINANKDWHRNSVDVSIHQVKKGSRGKL